MKKLLLASTALVASAGIAAADVALTGSAELGVRKDNGSDMTVFHHDLDVRFTMTGETDTGISFGAFIDLDEVANGIPSDFGPATVFVSAGGGTLTMGDTDGAYDARVAEMNLGGPGSLNDDETAHAGFNTGDGTSRGVTGADQIYFDASAGTVVQDSATLDTGDILLEAAIDSEGQSGFGLDGAEDGQVARFDYAFSGLTMSLSGEIDDADGGNSPIIGVGVAYDAALAGIDLGVGLAYQAQEDFAEVTGFSLTGTFANGLGAGVTYSQQVFEEDVSLEGETGDTLTHAGIGFVYAMNDLSLGINYGAFTLDGEEVRSGTGFAANYDLGGGLSARFGYGGSTLADSANTDSFSLGLAMAF